jgi:putative oxidoreductase
MTASWLTPRPDLASLILRLGLAAIFVPHGWFKIDVGFYASEAMIAGVSRNTQILVGFAELAGGLMMLVGLGSRLAAVVLMAIQLAAVILMPSDYGPLVIGGGIPARAAYLSVGPEYNLVLGLMALAVLVLGSGPYALDHVVARKWRANKAMTTPHQPAAA